MAARYMWLVCLLLVGAVSTGAAGYAQGRVPAAGAEQPAAATAEPGAGAGEAPGAAEPAQPPTSGGLPAPAAPAAPEERGAPVVFWGETLFRVYAKLGPFTAEDRAKAIGDRLERLRQDPTFHTDVVTVADHETITEILARGVTIATVGDEDATPEQLPRQVLGRQYAQEIQAAIDRVRRQTTPRGILLGVAFALLATVALGLIVLLVNRAFGFARARIDSWRGTRIRALRVQRVELLSADRIADAITGLGKLVRLVALLGLFYYYLSLVLGFFPWTAGVAERLVGYIVAALGAMGRGFVSRVPDLAFIAVIIVITHYVLRFVGFIFGEIGRGAVSVPGFDPEWAAPTRKLVRVVVVVVAVAAAFPYIPGSESPAFRGMSIFLAVLLSLGSTSAIANIIGGVVITYMRPFRIGDRVQIADTVGDVMERSMFVTRLRTVKNVDVTIPNSMVLASHIINYSSAAKERGLVLHTKVTIGYDVPWRQVHELLAAAARDTEHILEEPAPFVLQTSLDDFSVSYELNAHTNDPGAMAGTYSELHQNIQDRFNEAGVEIMSPQYTSFRSGDRPAMPEEYVGKRGGTGSAEPGGGTKA